MMDGRMERKKMDDRPERLFVQFDRRSREREGEEKRMNECMCMCMFT